MKSDRPFKLLPVVFACCIITVARASKKQKINLRKKRKRMRLNGPTLLRIFHANKN